MQTRREHNGLVWIDLECPTRDEVQSVVDDFDVAPLIADELLLPSSKPRAEFDDRFAYLVMHFPALRHSHHSREQEIDFLVSKNAVVTVHYDTIDPLHKFSKVFDVNSVTDRNELGDHAGFILFYMLKRLYKSVEHEVEFIRHDLSIIEEHIFTGQELQMVEAISRSARDLLSLRQAIEPHRELLRELESGGVKVFGAEFAPYLRAISDEYYRVHNHIMRQTESLHELRETNNSLLSTKQNETMRLLTIMALITLPLSLVAGIFGMDTRDMPFVDMPGAFWIVIFIMALLLTGMFAFFKYKKWL